MASPPLLFLRLLLLELLSCVMRGGPGSHPARQPVAGPSCTSRPRHSAVVPCSARGSSSLPRLTDVVGYARNTSYKCAACLLRPMQVYLYCHNRPRAARMRGGRGGEGERAAAVTRSSSVISCYGAGAGGPRTRAPHPSRLAGPASMRSSADPPASPAPPTVWPSSRRPAGPQWRSPRRIRIHIAAPTEIASE